MSENQEPKVEQQEQGSQEIAPAQTLTLEDLQNLDLSNPDNLPEELKNLKVTLPHRRVMFHLASNYKLRLSNPYGRKLTSKPSRSWYNGQLITTEEYSKLPEEETFAYRNQITSSKRK